MCPFFQGKIRNGFAGLKEIKKELEVTVYFPNPYSP